MKKWLTRPLGDVLLQRKEEYRIINAANETFVTVRLYGKGAVKRHIAAGKIPVMKSGYCLRAGDLIYSRIDARNGAFALVPYELDGAAVSKDFPTFAIMRDLMDPRFLAFFLGSDNFFAQLKAASSGTTNRQRIPEDALLSYEVPVPPIPEQERIVWLLEEVEQLRERRKQADRKAADFTAALFTEMIGDMGSGGCRWPKKRLGQLVTIESTLVDPRAEVFQDLPHIGADRIESGTGKLLRTMSAKEEGLISGKYLFDERDVLYSKIRPTLRKAALFTGRGLCSADMYPLRPGPKLVREFLWAYLLSDEFTSRAVDLSARANLPKINRAQLYSIEVPVPPLSTQQEFAKRITEIHELKAEQAVSRQRLDDLFQSMLHQAFSGEL